MKVTIAQLNPTIGDMEGNFKKVESALCACIADTPDLVVFPELSLVGYPPRDLLERPWFIRKAEEAVEKVVSLSKQYRKTGILVGAPVANPRRTGRGVFNTALLVCRGTILFQQNKSLLPTYDVFDEARYFEPAAEVHTVPFAGEVLGITVCEDAWNRPEFWPKATMYKRDPVADLVKEGATLLLNISASPFNTGKEEIRYRLVRDHAMKNSLPFVFVNQVGGNDELVFDGRSMCFDNKGELISILPSFEEGIVTVDTAGKGVPGSFQPQGEAESIYHALILGIRDYLRKCGFSKAVIGLSGGIDSAVTCCLAKEALGRENVLGVSMPSAISSKGSVEDSRVLAQNLGIPFKVIPISGIYDAYLESLGTQFEGMEKDITEENIQARIRGNILMALSNKFGSLVLSTGNKSELAVGYCTLYGDMSGGLSVLSDVPKTMVYELTRFINRAGEVIPAAIVEKPPSAELKPDQLDQDTLPPYEVLDAILRDYVDEGLSINEIVKKNFDEETVRWVVRAINTNEYKRRQAAPGLRVTSKAFGMGRRMVVAARYSL